MLVTTNAAQVDAWNYLEVPAPTAAASARLARGQLNIDHEQGTLLNTMRPTVIHVAKMLAGFQRGGWGPEEAWTKLGTNCAPDHGFAQHGQTISGAEYPDHDRWATASDSGALSGPWLARGCLLALVVQEGCGNPLRACPLT